MIPNRAIQISTQKGDIIFDPFGGGGSTFQEAQFLERYWLGSEITTIDPIIERMETRFPKSTQQEPPEVILKVFR